jgi:hypothetical protein
LKTHTHVNNSAGKGLRVGAASDSESEEENPSSRKKRRSDRGSGINSVMDEDDV